MDYLNGNIVSVFLVSLGLWPLIIVVTPVLIVRRYGVKSVIKCRAIMLQGISIFLIFVTAQANMEFGGKDLYLFLVIAVALILWAVFRKYIFPYQLSCAGCETKLSFKTIYMLDNNLCDTCRTKNGRVKS
jgi:hypothetical protein